MRCAGQTLAAGLLPLFAGCAGMLSWEGAPISSPAVQAPEPVVPERPVGRDEHVVIGGDTVYSIAFRHNLDYRELARWNEIGGDYLIRPGQVLRLTPPPPPRLARYQLGDVETQAAPDTDVEEISRPQPITAQTPPPVPVTPPVAVPGVAGTAGGAGTPAVGAPAMDWTWPTQGVVTRGFDIPAGSKGLDFTGRAGQPIFAAAPGRVVYSGNALKGYGELIIIKHDDAFLSAYGYNRTRLVKEGDVVTAGQPIGEMGVGPENKPLLHFEIRERGKPVNPVGFLPSRKKAVAGGG